MGATGAKQSQPVPGYGSEQTRIIRTTSSEVKGSPDAADAGLRDLTDEELGLAGQHRNPAALPSTLHHRRGALSDSESFAWASDAQEGDCLYELHLTLATATDLVNPFFFRRMRPYVAMFVGGQHTDSQPAEHCLRGTAIWGESFVFKLTEFVRYLRLEVYASPRSTESDRALQDVFIGWVSLSLIGLRVNETLPATVTLYTKNLKDVKSTGTLRLEVQIKAKDTAALGRKAREMLEQREQAQAGQTRSFKPRTEQKLEYFKGRMGLQKQWMGYSAHLPVVLVPGFMSSCLQVQESKLCPDWEGDLVWLSIAKAGLAKVGKIQRAQKAGHDASADHEFEDAMYDQVLHLLNKAQGSHPEKEDGRAIFGMATSKFSDTVSFANKGVNKFMHKYGGNTKEKEQVREQKNLWIRHMALQANGHDEQAGVRVRAVQGCAGCAFLDPALKFSTYVWGPLIQGLQDVGYVEGKNLEAAPYDWRLPPHLLEARDQYFTSLVFMIETMKRRCHKPVVLCAHSMGNQVVKYFLEFALQNKGQQWLDDNVYSWCAVGAPTLGAPKALRTKVEGGKQGLDAFLSDEEGLVFSRTCGSASWLLPTGHLDSLELRTSYKRVEGLIKVDVIRCEVPSERFPEYWNTPGLVVQIQSFNKSLFSSRKVGLRPHFGETFQFVSLNPRELTDDDILTMTVRTKELGMPSGLCSSLCVLRLNVKEQLNGVSAWSGWLAFKPVQGYLPLSWKARLAQTDHQMYVRISFQPDFTDTDQPSVLRIPTSRAFNVYRSLGMRSVRRPDEIFYAPRTVEDILKFEDLDHQWREDFMKNPLYGIDSRQLSVPPIRRMKVIYGVDLETEAMTFWKVRKARYKKGKLISRLKPDIRVQGGVVDGYRIRDGVAYETHNTRQVRLDDKEIVYHSGDGTVPYDSLRYPLTWRDKIAEGVQVCEIPGAEHRDILIDGSFQAELFRYICKPPEVLIHLWCLEATNLLSKDIYAGGSDPFAEAIFQGFKFRTETLQTTCRPKWVSNYFAFGIACKADLLQKDQHITITLYDANRFRPVEFLGGVVLSVRDLMGSKNARGKSWYELEALKGTLDGIQSTACGVQGSVHIEWQIDITDRKQIDSAFEAASPVKRPRTAVDCEAGGDDNDRLSDIDEAEHFRRELHSIDTNIDHSHCKHGHADSASQAAAIISEAEPNGGTVANDSTAATSAQTTLAGRTQAEVNGEIVTDD